MSLRFHHDEHVPNAIANALRRCAIEVTTTVQAALQGQTVEKHIANCMQEICFKYTQVDDFLIAAA